jgi:hypothetical protein
MMVAELIAGLALALVAAWFVMRPVLRPVPAAGPRAAEDGEAEEDLSPRAQALSALKEIEFDRATGKLGDDDYAALKAKYTGEALDAMRAEEGRVKPVRAAPAATGPVCPEHGPRPEGDAVFCSACGRRLASAPGFCRRCGAGLAAGASFCNGCGLRVAA